MYVLFAWKGNTLLQWATEMNGCLSHSKKLAFKKS
jgi:hypothetical protein